MTADEIREFFLQLPAVTEETPFGPEVLVYKIGGKMFATLGFEEEEGIEVARSNLKCDPDRSIQLRAEHEAIQPGYHMNKKHWNTLVLDGSVSGELTKELVEHSYQLVFNSLTKKLRDELAAAD